MDNRNACINGEKNDNSNKCSAINSAAPSLFSLPPKQYALFSSLLGILLVDILDLDQQNSFGNFLVGTGTSLLVAAAQGQLIQSESEKADQVRQQISKLKQQIIQLEQQLD